MVPVYLLDRSILSGAQVREAFSDRDPRSDTHVVNVEFDEEGARLG